MDITIVIPCRAGSTRVKIKQAIKLGLPIVIDSDSDIAKNLAKQYNVNFTQRPEFYASSECNNSQYYEYLGNSISTEYIMILQPTAPLLNDVTLQECYNTFCKNIDEYDSLVTALFAKKHAWYQNRPINYDLQNTPNSQDLDPIILPTFNVMIAKVSSLLQTKNIITDKCLFYPVEEIESIEIDTQTDFDIAEILYERKNK